MSKNGGGDTTTVQKADPWKEQQPFLLDIFNEAMQQYHGPGPQYFPGQTTVGFNADEIAAQNMARQYATGQAQQLANQGQSAQSWFLNDVMNADSNPYMADYAQAAIRPVTNALQREWLPGIDSGAVASGQYGGSRQGIAQGLAISDANRQALDTTSKMYSDMYNQNLAARQRAVALNPSVMESGLMPTNILSGIGTQQRELEQSMLNDAVARWEWEQALPASRLAQYMSMVQGQYGGQSTSTTTGDVGGASTGQRIAGAAMGGIGTYAALAMNPATLAIAPWAAGAMAIAALFA